MRVSIIGGGGLVGSSAAYALQCAGLVSEICLVDANPDAAEGHAQELTHGACLTGGMRTFVGTMQEAVASQVVVITAGLRRKPEESRLDLINRNVDLFLQILAQLRQAGLRETSYLVVVSNPVDVLTYLAVRESGLPWQRVIGLGTLLDTMRFRSLIARRIRVPADQVQALILGEHGDSMVPIWSGASVAGVPLDQWPGWDLQAQREVFEQTRQAGATLLRLKGGSGFAVGLAIREVVASLVGDRRRVLPVSTLQQGAYDVRDVCMSVPTIVGCGGVKEQVTIPLSAREVTGLRHSAQVLRDTLSQIQGRKLAAQPAPASQAVVAASGTTRDGQRSVARVVPRAAWQTPRAV
ncbi:MAG: lactate dehydrogenase [Gemmataceae bacterium]